MYIVIWKYSVKQESVKQFVDYYKSDGEWVKLFQQDSNYIGTDFYQNDASEFMTIDQWISKEAYEKFKKEFVDKYTEIDRNCEEFTTSETFLGDYYSID